jgi:hypothetical protein
MLQCVLAQLIFMDPIGLFEMNHVSNRITLVRTPYVDDGDYMIMSIMMMLPLYAILLCGVRTRARIGVGEY